MTGASTNKGQRLLSAYILVVDLSAFVLSSAVLIRFDVPDWNAAVFLAMLCVLAEYYAVRLPDGSAVSLSSSLAFAAVLSGGPATGIIVALIGSISLADIQVRKPLRLMLFNTSQYVIATSAAAGVMLALGIAPLEASGGAPTGGAVWVLAALLASVALAAANGLLAGVVVAIRTGSTVLKVIRQFLGWHGVSIIALALLGLVMAELLYTAGVAGTLLIVVPYSIARQMFEVYQRQSAAYRETVRSLVTALEAKDSYTRGHSERVAWYSRLLCDCFGLPEVERQRIEWAALLHDLGKVAIDSDMLRKPGRLSSEEYDLVREHPARASEILSGIDFLEDCIPYIEAHHERVDGEGYPRGLRGHEIPFGARILSVADSFDAMTSSRAYRDAISYDGACEELRRLSGKQFDDRCVDAFLAAIDAETVGRLVESRDWSSQWQA